jgi:hypothetical protein
MKVTKYFAPPMDVVRMGPHTSECTISKGFVAHLAPSVGNDNRCCLLLMHASQTKGERQETWVKSMPVTMLRNARTPFSFK